jgi:hypothetical protein
LRWIKLKRKTHTAFRTEDRKYLLSPITAPVGKGLPKYVLYGMVNGKAERFLGTFYEKKFAEEKIERWEKLIDSK